MTPSRGRTFLQLAAQPDDIAELIRIADQVQNVPREWLDSREDMFHALRRVGGRIRKIAGRIDRIEPCAAPRAIPHAPPRRRLPPTVRSAQLALF